MNKQNTDVVIVGAGPAGVATALNLVALNPSWKERIVVLEKATFPRPKTCGGGLSPLSLSLLDELEINTPTFLCEKAQVHFKCNSVQISYLLRTVWRQDFDALMAKVATERGIRIVQNTQVENITWDENTVQIHTENDMYCAKVVVGADGVYSQVRKQAFPQLHHNGLAVLLETEVPVTCQHPHFREGKILVDFSTYCENICGYYWEFPFYKAGKPTLNCGIFNTRQNAQNLRDILKKRMLLSGHALRNLKGWAIRPLAPFQPMAKPGVVLVGDAAGVDPLFGEGIGYSLFYGKKAAQAVAQAFARNGFSFSNYKQQCLASRAGLGLVIRKYVAEIFGHCPALINALAGHDLTKVFKLIMSL